MKEYSNVNVPTQTSNHEESLRLATLTAELVDALKDSKSRGFFRLVAQHLPEPIIYAALSEVRDAQRRGETKRNPGAHFTYLVKQKAQELGIDLSARV